MSIGLLEHSENHIQKQGMNFIVQENLLKPKGDRCWKQSAMGW